MESLFQAAIVFVPVWLVYVTGHPVWFWLWLWIIATL